MHSAIPSLLAVLLESAVRESLRRRRQGKLTEGPYYFIPVSQMCENFILSWLGILKFKMSLWLWRFLTIFWRVVNIAKNVWRCSGELSELPKLFKSDNFSLFWSCHDTKSLFSAFIHCRYSIFSGVVDNNSIRTQKYRSLQLLIVTE